MRKQNDLYFDNLNIGGTLEALVYSYIHTIPLIIDKPVLPFELDMCPLSWDITRFGYERNSAVSKLQLWDRLTFLLSVSGHLLFPNNIQNIRAVNKKITIVTTDNSYFSVHYKKVKLFEIKETNKIEMYDWFTVRSGCTHSIDDLQSDSNFVKQIIFYPSRRPSVTKGNKDLVAISFIEESKKDSSEYAEGICRLKVLRAMETAGIQGTKSGYNKHGRSLFTSVKIEHVEREYKNGNSSSPVIEKLLSKPPNKKSDLWKLTQKFLLQQRTSTLLASSR